MDIIPYSIPLTKALKTSAGTIENREGFLVRIDALGHVGFGEAAPMQPFSVEGLSDCERDLGRGAHKIREVGPGEALSVLQSDLCSSARCGLEVALLDWMARQADAPLSFLLGGEGFDMLPVSALVATPEDGVEAVKRGHRLLKLKVGMLPLQEEVERLEAFLAAQELPVLLRLDANGAFTLKQAEAFLEATDHLPVESVEDPLALSELHHLKALHRFQVGLGVDEALRHPEALEEIFSSRSADYLVLKPMWCGGFLQAHAIALSAAQQGVGVALSTALDGAIGRAACIQLAASLPSEAIWPSGIDTGNWLSSDHGELKLEIHEGHLVLNQLAGLGVGGLH